MARIALAGGSGSVGKAFVEALANSKHVVVVLSRSERESSIPNIKYAKVDYDSIPSLVTLLENHEIDTVLSSITMNTTSSSQAQLNLIHAAEQSSVTTRFIPSEWGVIGTKETAAVDPYGKYLLENAALLEKTKLQYTRIAIGWVLDYWGMPHIHTTFPHPFPWVLDMANGTASIPGTGEEKLSVTYVPDLAKFVVRLLDEAEWPEWTAVVGQDVTFNQLVKWAEDATGTKFKVVYDSLEKLESGKATPLNDSTGPAYLEEYQALFGVMMLKGFILLPADGGFRLNDRFPELNVLTAEALIKDIWTKR